MAAYPRQLTPRGEQILAPHLEQLRALRPGQSLTLTSEDPSHLSVFRSYFYIWLAQEELSTLYRAKRISKTKLMILRLDEPQLRVEEMPEDQAEEIFVKRELLDFETEEQVIEKLAQEELDPELKLKIIREWKRVSGLET